MGQGQAHHDFAQMGVGPDIVSRSRQLVERKYPVHEQCDAAFRERGKQVAEEPAHRLGALCGRQQLVGKAEDLQPLAVHRVQIDFGLQCVVDITDDGEPSLVGERPQAVGNSTAADEVGRDVDTGSKSQTVRRQKEPSGGRFK